MTFIMAARVKSILLGLCWLSLMLHGCLAETTRPSGFWLAYSLPPYTSQSPHRLGRIAWLDGVNVTTVVRLEDVTGIPPTAPKHVRLGIIDENIKSAFTGNTVLVARDALEGQDTIIHIHVDDAMIPYAVSLGQGSIMFDQLGSGPLPKMRAYVQRKSVPPTPFLNKPVVLSSEGKVQEPPAEKTLLQK